MKSRDSGCGTPGVDNPKFLARTIGDWMTNWQGPKGELGTYADVKPLTFSPGEYTFKQHCAACHTLGQGEHIGPDLLGVTKIRDREWLARFIYAPDKMLASGDPIAKELFEKYRNVRMPNLDLSREDVVSIVNYLIKQDADAPTVSSSPPKSAAPASMTSLVDPYLRIQEALSADSLTGVSDAARRIASEASKVGTSAASIGSAAGPLQQAADLKSARAAFGTLSAALITYAKTSHATLGDDIHVAYCPMLQKYWFQKGTTIRNPYYGKAMLECGRLNPTLPDLSN